VCVPYFIGFLSHLKGLVGGGYKGFLLGGVWHTWRATRVAHYMHLLGHLTIFGLILEGKLLETLIAILGGVYLFISWRFGIVKTLIILISLDLFCWRLPTYYGV
jgi:hypothetical protein